MNFGEALAKLKAGHTVTRSGWNGSGMYLKLQVPDAFSKMSRPYIYMFTADQALVPWVASQTDLLSSDWSETQHGAAAGPTSGDQANDAPAVAP